MFSLRGLVLLALGVLIYAGWSATATAATARSSEPLPADVPTGHYVLDRSHSTLVFRVSHIGYSFYTASFSHFDATLELDSAQPEASKLAVSIDLSSLSIPAPPEGFLQELLGPQWINAIEYPELTFQSTQIVRTGSNTANVIGNCTLNGHTAPVTLQVIFNGGYPGLVAMDPHARVGFSATGSLNRSAFGITLGIPPKGTTLGVGDEVKFMIETEFTGPPLAVKQ